MNKTFELIQQELERAKVHPKFNSFHEFYGVLMEEVEELFDEIKKKHQDKQRIKEEAIQVAAMVFKMIDNLIEDSDGVRSNEFGKIISNISLNPDVCSKCKYRAYDFNHKACKPCDIGTNCYYI